jgi:CDP-diacylglycerol--glycerol-3-phosphate 3-phosphatidyltransferase
MKNKKFRYSDLITTARVFLVAIFAFVLCFEPKIFGLWIGLILISIIFFSDFLDGVVARRIDAESKFGAFYDIVGDRITEIVILVPFIYLRIAHPIVIIYFIVKGFLIDYNRFVKFVESNNVPFKQLKSGISKFLVSHRVMRAAVGSSKLVLSYLYYTIIFYPEDGFKFLASIVAAITIIVSLLRTMPPFIESWFIKTQET